MSRAEWIAAMREIVDWFEEHPEVKLPTMYTNAGGELCQGIDIYINPFSDPGGADVKTQMGTVARAMGKAAKVYDDDRFQLMRDFGPLKVIAWAPREEVCERIVVDTYDVTEEVPDPEAVAALPKVTVTTTKEVVEWRCTTPLLADAATRSDLAEVDS